MSQGHWNVSGTLKCLRDIGMSQGYWNVSGTLNFYVKMVKHVHGINVSVGNVSGTVKF